MKVATFYEPHDGKRPMLSHIRTYTRDYNPSWKGCIVYDIDAKSGTKAKLLARQRRFVQEEFDYLTLRNDRPKADLSKLP